MKKLNCYWMSLEFNPRPENAMYEGYMVPTKNEVIIEVSDDATEEYINDLLRRKDLKRDERKA